MKDYITRFRELVAPDMYQHDGTPMLAIKQENVEQFITTLATGQFEAGKAVGREEASSYLSAHATEVENDTWYTIHVSEFESARNQKSI